MISGGCKKALTLSAHAAARLSQRTRLSAGELLFLIGARALVKVYSVMQPRRLRCEQKNLRRCNYSRYHFVLVWSRSDECAVLVLLASETAKIITVLRLDHVGHRHLRGRVSDELILLAKQRAEIALSGGRIWAAEEILVSWLDASGLVKRKRLRAEATPLVRCDKSQIEKTISEIARAIAVGGQRVWAVLRDRKDPLNVSCEVSLG
jgi:hypothetical protein